MGSSSSKAKKLTVPRAPTTGGEHSSRPGVVANVNKLELLSQASTEKQGISDASVSDAVEYNNTIGERDRTFQANDKNKVKKEGNNKNNVNRRECKEDDTALVFEDDSDLEVNIDEVLKIPVAVDNSKANKDKDKTRRGQKNDKSNVDRQQHASPERNETEVSTQAAVTLPETYVQRMQRQQYKFQHKLLLHDKEEVRNPREWQEDHEDNNKIIDDYQMQFDATKFRAANRSLDPKKDLFTTTEPEGNILATLAWSQQYVLWVISSNKQVVSLQYVIS